MFNKSDYMIKWKSENKDKVAAYRKRYYIKNRKDIISKNRATTLKNHEMALAYSIRYRLDNKDRLKEYRDNNKALINATKRVYNQKNKDKRNLWNRNYRARKKTKSMAIEVHNNNPTNLYIH
jgi:hypothetical protein